MRGYQVNLRIVAAVAPIVLAMVGSAEAEVVTATFSGSLTGSFTYDTGLEPFSTSQYGNEVLSTYGREYSLTLDTGFEDQPRLYQDREFSFKMYQYPDEGFGTLALEGPDFYLAIYAAGKFPIFGLPRVQDVTASDGIGTVGPNGDYYHFNVSFSGGNFSQVPPVPAVPEPATWGMMILGFGVVGASLRRRRSSVRTTVRFV